MIRLLKSYLDSCPEAQREKLDRSLPPTPSRPADTQTTHLSQHRPAPCFGGGGRRQLGTKFYNYQKSDGTDNSVRRYNI